MNDHLAKPIDRELLRHALDVWGGKRAAVILNEGRVRFERSTAVQYNSISVRAQFPHRNSVGEVGHGVGHLSEDSSGVAEMLLDSVVDYAIYFLALDGTVMSWNPGAQRIKGYRAEEIIGLNFSAFYTDADIAAGKPSRSLGAALSAGTFATEGWRLRKDGTRFWASVVIDAVRNPMGEVVGFAKITGDLTQHAALPQVSEESGCIAQVLIDNVVDYAIYLLDIDGIVKSWNPGAQLIKGYSAQEIIGSNFSVFYTDDDIRAREPLRVLEIARTGGRFEAEAWRVRKGGTRFWASVVIDAVRSPSGQVVGFAKVTRDLTRSAALRQISGECGSVAQLVSHKRLETDEPR